MTFLKAAVIFLFGFSFMEGLFLMYQLFLEGAWVHGPALAAGWAWGGFAGLIFGIIVTALFFGECG